MENSLENKESRTILGLDVSTATIGMSVVAVNNEIIVKPLEVSHLRLNIPKKFKGAEALFLKNQMFCHKLKEFADKYSIDRVVIEEPLVSSNNANTVSALLKFNGIVSWSVYDILGVIPEYISSYDARKYGMPELMAVRKYDKKGNIYPFKKIKSAINNDELVLFGEYPFDVAKKYVIWNYVSERFPNIQWIEDKKGELKKENFDASDSLICILGYLNKTVYKEEEPKIVECSEQEVTYESQKTKVIEYVVSFCNQTFPKRIDLPF